MAISNFIDRIKIGNSTGEIAIGSSAYGVCDSLASTTAKTVYIPGFTLNPGTTIHVKFENVNSAANPTLNVSSTGAKPIVLYGSTPADTAAETTGWHAGAVIALTYDGTSWVRDQGFNTDTDSLLRTYAVSTTNELPLIAASATNTIGNAPTHSSGYAELYGVIPATDNLRITINPSTGRLTVPGGITASIIGNAATATNVEWSGILNTPTTLGGYGITDAHITSGVITLGNDTITPVTSVNGHTGNTVTLVPSDLGLANALHFIGQATQTITNGGTQHPTIANQTYSGVDGDVVIDKDALREYVWSDGAWLMLGYTSSQAYAQPSTDPVTNQWISKITQNTDGTISATLGVLDTSGIWSGTATNVSTTADTTNTLYLVGVTNGTAQELKRDSNITIQGINFTGGVWQASTIAIDYGGTGATSVNKYGILYGNSSQDAYASTITGDAGLVIIGGGISAAPSWYEGLILSGDGTVASPYLATFGGDIAIGGGLTLGDSQNWGDEYTPIYWNNGVPGKVTTILRESFTLGTSTMSTAAEVTTTITNNTSANSRVVQIVVTDGMSNLHSVIEWQLNSSNQIQLSATTQKVVSGYILYIK